MFSSTPRPHFTLGRDPVPILQEAGWAPGLVWTDGKSRPHRDSIPDHPARNQSLYRLSYSVHNILVCVRLNKNQYYIFCVCVCVCITCLGHSTCNAHAPYYIVICGLSGCAIYRVFNLKVDRMDRILIQVIYLLNGKLPLRICGRKTSFLNNFPK